MSNALTFILKLQDMLTPGMRQAANISNTAAAKIESEFAKISAGGRKMGASVNELRARLDSINKVRFSTNLEKEFNIATRAAHRLENQIDKIENKGKAGSGSGGMLGNFVKGNLIAGAITGGLNMAKDLAVDTYQTSLKNNGLNTAINSTTGGQGKEAVRQTDFLANKYGLNYEASLEGVKTLTGGLKSMNMPLAEQMKIFEGVSTGVAAMKLGAEQSKGAMLALGQMASKGTVSAEELRGQLGERIPGAFGIAAKAMNVTEAQLGKMMEKGEVAAKYFLPKFAAEMQKTFGADALAAANGPQAIQERFNNAIFKMKAGIGDGLMPVITPILEKFTELAVTIMPYVQQGIQFITAGIQYGVELVAGLTTGTGEWGSYIAVVKDFAFGLWMTIKSIWGNVWNIISGIIQWIGKSELLKDVFWAIGKIGEGILFVIRGIGDTISWIWSNIIKPILDAIDWAYSKIKGLFGGGKTTVEIVDGTKAAPFSLTPKPAAAPYNPLSNSAFPMYQAGSFTPAAAVSPLTLNGAPSGSRKETAGIGDKNTKSKAEGINSGGQRSIVINIGKQIEKLEMHVMTAKEGVDEIGNMVKEELRKVMYSLNGVAAS